MQLIPVGVGCGGKRSSWECGVGSSGKKRIFEVGVRVGLLVNLVVGGGIRVSYSVILVHVSSQSLAINAMDGYT